MLKALEEHGHDMEIIKDRACMFARRRKLMGLFDYLDGKSETFQINNDEVKIYSYEPLKMITDEEAESRKSSENGLAFLLLGCSMLLCMFLF